MRRIYLLLLPLLGFAGGCDPDDSNDPVTPDMYGPAPVEYKVKPQAEADGAAIDPTEGNSAEQDVANESLPLEQE